VCGGRRRDELRQLTHFSLFSGIGGLDLAAEWAGFETVGQVEFADYPTKVLEKHWPDVPRWRDIRDVTAGSFRERTGLHTVDVISGGFPCQPFSVAGKQKGKGDDRYLWPEMLRVIRELKPHWVLGENVPGILRIAGDTVCQDMEREGYDVGIFDYEAAAVGAPHRRERIFFVGNAKHDGLSPATLSGRPEKAGRDHAEGKNQTSKSEGASEPGNDEVVADADQQGLQGRFSAIVQECPGERIAGESGTYVCHTASAGLPDRANIPLGEPGQESESQRPDGRPAEPRLGGMVDGLPGWLYEPDVPRVATGVKDRVGRLKCLGNAVVPQQAYPIFAAIAETEQGGPQ